MNELTYHREGDCLLPDLILPEAPRIGLWGMRQREFLRKHHSGIYTGLLLSGKLNAHLEEVDRLAEEMLFQLVDQMARVEGVTEELKATYQMAWVRAMNSIRARAEETIFTEIIYS